MLPAAPSEEVFTIPQPSWLVRVGLPALALVPAMVLVGYPWLFADDTTGFQVAGMVLLVVVVALLTRKYGTILTIGPYGATLEEPNWTQSMLYSDVKQLREYHPDNSPAYLQLEPLEPTGSTLRISAKFPDYQRIRALLATYVPDLDAQEQTRHSRQVHLPAALRTARPRPPQTSSRPARRWARALNLAAIGALGWMVLGGPYEAATALGLAITLLAAGALWHYRGLLQLTTSRQDRRPDVALALWGPVAFIFIRHWAFLDIIDWEPLWPLAGVVGVGFGLVLLNGIRQQSGARSQLHVGLALVLAAGYGLGVAALYNCAYGGLGQARYPARLQEKYTTYNKGRNYHLIATAWGPPGAPTVFSVSQARYERQQPGDTLTMRLHRGRLGAAWGELVGSE